MRLSALFLRIGVFIIAAFVSAFAARATVAVVETRSVVSVQEDLIDAGHNWASVLGDGLQVIIEGEAPTEAARFNAITTAGKIVDASRVIDNMSVIDSAGIAPPEFAIEILRNDSGVSLIGLIPAGTDRDLLASRIASIADGQPVTDLLEVADYPVPETWPRALNYALRALDELPRSKISVTSRRVSVKAISDSADEKRRLETRLARNTPENVAIALEITAPRPVISPFLTRFTLDDEGARFITCAVDTAEAERKIVWAATQIGFEGRTNCTQALGAPSRSWGDAVALSIEAVGKLGGGTVTVSNTDIAVVALEGTDQGTFDNVIGELENNLPDVYALEAELPRAPESGDEGPPQFTATRSPEGAVQLRGRVADELMNTTAEQFAFAKFGQRNVTMGTRVVDGLPSGWSIRVLAGIEALSQLSNGSVTVQPDLVVIRGNTGRESASTEIASLLIDKLGTSTEVDIDVTYVKELDPIAGLPTPEECVAQITAVTEVRKITFEPGAADLAADTQGVIDDIADILKKCANLRIQIAGYTDSQGREEMNQQLSQQRAQSVLDALRVRRVPVGAFEAIGFGEADPIADNDTEEGREANRRIEFSLIVPEPIPEEPTALEEIEAANEDAAEEPAE
ncbi:OmpA-OmpF porin, OOP family [Cognatiyoonia koreensis]|uniref:OmpA-OmpF porin, OOP family n=1 Tax=Cognatiyoonia koreensis TaxID=364200 RepID=A0A1I0RDT0_9RHOB|nr:OmpA family protein [Cognatiyoonia koreensis]SEW38984.1 OmpA-OmpF porin, OOP family [Cognatiyoonia koreensis]